MNGMIARHCILYTWYEISQYMLLIYATKTVI